MHSVYIFGMVYVYNVLEPLAFFTKLQNFPFKHPVAETNGPVQTIFKIIYNFNISVKFKLYSRIKFILHSKLEVQVQILLNCYLYHQFQWDILTMVSPVMHVSINFINNDEVLTKCAIFLLHTAGLIYITKRIAMAHNWNNIHTGKAH